MSPPPLVLGGPAGTMDTEVASKMSIDTDQPAVTCQSCGGTARRGTVNLAVWQETRLVAIRDVPAYVCETCQEQSFDRETNAAVADLSARGFPRSDSWEEIVVQVFRLPPRQRSDSESRAGLAQTR